MVAEGIFRGPAGTKVRGGKIWVCEEQMAKLASLGDGRLGLGRVTNQMVVDPCRSGSSFRAGSNSIHGGVELLEVGASRKVGQVIRIPSSLSLRMGRACFGKTIRQQPQITHLAQPQPTFGQFSESALCSTNKRVAVADKSKRKVHPHELLQWQRPWINGLRSQ